LRGFEKKRIKRAGKRIIKKSENGDVSPSQNGYEVGGLSANFGGVLSKTTLQSMSACTKTATQILRVAIMIAHIKKPKQKALITCQ